MRKFLSILIAIILISVTLLPINVSAASNPGIYIDCFVPSNTSTPLVSLTCLWSNIKAYAKSYDSNIDDNDIRVSGIIFKTINKSSSNFTFDCGVSISISHSDGSSSSATYFFATNISCSVGATINYIYFNGQNYTTTRGQQTYIPYTYTNNSVANLQMVFALNPYTAPVPSYGITVFNVIGEDGNTLTSSTISNEDITDVIGCTDWIGKELYFNPDAGQLQINVYCSNHNTMIAYPTGIHISPLFVLQITDDQNGSTIDLPVNGTINLVDYDLQIRPSESSGFTFSVSDAYTQIHNIPINFYNAFGTSLLSSDSVSGTYLKYSVKVDYYQDSNGNVIADLILSVYGNSDLQNFHISVNLADHNITDLKGISFTPNKDIPDIKFDHISDIAIYTGSFYPESLTQPLNFYILTPSDVEVIKLNNSEDINQILQNSIKDYLDIKDRFDHSKGGYKQGGFDQADQAGNNIVDYLTGDAADVFGDFLNTIYNIPLIVPMMLLVFSVATIGYIFYGKQG